VEEPCGVCVVKNGRWVVGKGWSVWEAPCVVWGKGPGQAGGSQLGKGKGVCV